MADGPDARADDHELRPETGGELLGMIAEFARPDDLIAAARAAREAGYRRIDGHSPFPLNELPEAIGFAEGRLIRFAVIGMTLGTLGGLAMQWYANVASYRLNVGGRPLDSWPAFMLPAFELGVLAAVLAVIVGMLRLNGLPKLHHPLFDVKNFALATEDRFFLLIGSDDPRFEALAVRAFLEGREPLAVSEVRG